jgi:hypothetical protein
MAQSGYTPVLLYASGTTGNTPSASNLTSSSSGAELALNYYDGKLFYKDSTGTVQVLATKGAGTVPGSNTQVIYNNSGALGASANMTFNGTSLTLANDASIHGLTVGQGAGSVSTNTAVGNTALASITTGATNVGVGYYALNANSTGSNNVAVGRNALQNTNADSNVGIGDLALVTNSSGTYNVAIGRQALYSNTTASNNTAVGYQAGYSNTTGYSNAYFGYQTGYSGTTAYGNSAFGCGIPSVNGSPLQAVTTGYYNCAFGEGSLTSLTTGYQNSAYGPNSGAAITSGSQNSILGGYNGNQGGLDIRTASNYIVLSDGAGNPRQIIDNNGNVGIGTTSPSAKLTVNGDALIHGLTVGLGAGAGALNTVVGVGALATNSSGSAATAIGYNALASSNANYNTAVGRLALTATTAGVANTSVGSDSASANTTGSYNVSVGMQSLTSNTTASYNTAVGYQAGYNSTGGSSTFVGYSAGSGVTTGTQNNFFGTASGYLVTSGNKNTIIGQYSGNQGGLDIRTSSNYIVLSDGDGNPRQIIDNNGNVGIGVTPSAWGTTKALQFPGGSIGGYTNGSNNNQSIMLGNAYFGASGGVYINSDYATYYRQYAGTHAWFNAPSGTAGNAITFTQAMTLDNSGNFGVGTTTLTSSLTNGFSVYQAANSTYTAIGHSSGTSSGAWFISFSYAGAQIASITQSGTTAVLYNTSSDQRLKTNIVDAPEGNVDAIKVRSFDWIADGSHQTYGMVAQELLEVAPYAVSQPEDPEEMMGVDYSKLVPMLVKEIQSLRARVAQLESKGS